MGRMEDQQRVYRLLKLKPFHSTAVEISKNCIRGEWARDEMDGFGEMIWIGSGTSYAGSWQRYHILHMFVSYNVADLVLEDFHKS